MARFPVVLRGYERAQVDALIARIDGTLGRGDGDDQDQQASTGHAQGRGMPISADEVRKTRFDIVLRGYDQRAVDELLQESIRRLAAADRRSKTRRPVVGARWLIDWIENAQFGSSGLRSGYDVRDVDAFLDRVVTGLRGMAPQVTPEDIMQSRFRAVRFGPGYDEEEVDLFLDQLAAALNGGRRPPS